MAEETNGSPYPGYTRPERVTLPSGAVFLLRKPNLMKMIRKGQLPNSLMEIVQQAFQERDGEELRAEAELKGVTEEQVLEERQQDAAHEREQTPPIPETLTAQEGLDFADVLVYATIVRQVEPVELYVETEPPVSDESPLTATGALSMEAISDDDRQFILSWANEDADALARFPAESGREDRGGDSGEVRATAELAAGHPV